MSISLIQSELQKENLQGWLFFDFHKSNRLMWEMLKIPQHAHISRKIFYWVPKKGTPWKIVHKIERHVLDFLPGETKVYGKREELEEILKKIQGRVAMEYSTKIPYISQVDGGTIDYLRDLGFEIVSSGPLIQGFTSTLSEEQIESHRKAAKILDQTVEEAFDFIRKKTLSSITVREGDVVDFILSRFKDHRCTTEHSPMVSRGKNSANPHYFQKERGDVILRTDFIMIDLWCKLEGKESIYADITRVAVGEAPHDKMQKAFSAVRNAQKKAVNYIETHKNVRGCDVDTLCRSYLEEQGFGAYVMHRTGHNIHTELHGPGANLDSFETLDERCLIPNTCYSVEPALYFPEEFGLRLEHDILITSRVEVTGGVEETLRVLY